MLSRLDDALAEMGDEVASLRIAPPSALRRRAEARRRTRSLAAIGAVAVVAVGTAATGAVSLPGSGGSQPGAQAMSPEPTSTCDGGPADVKGSPGVRPVRGRYLTVFLAQYATAGQVAAVRDLLTSSPLVESFHFETREAAYERLKQIYACAPDLIEATKAESLPESFRVTVHSETGFVPLADLLERMAGVDAVVSNSRPE